MNQFQASPECPPEQDIIRYQSPIYKYIESRGRPFRGGPTARVVVNARESGCTAKDYTPGGVMVLVAKGCGRALRRAYPRVSPIFGPS